MANKTTGIAKNKTIDDLKIVFIPISRNDCLDPYLLDEIQDVVAQIILLCSKKGRPPKAIEEESNAA